MMSLPIYFFLLVQLLAVSYIDLRERKISNIWPALNIALFVLLLFLFPDQYKIISAGKLHIDQILYSIVFFVVGFVLFALRIMGGGDSKFLVSLFLIIPYSIQEKAFIHLLFSTMIIGSFLLLVNLSKHVDVILDVFKNGNLRRLKMIFGSKFPFAPVILISWIWLGLQIKLV